MSNVIPKSELIKGRSYSGTKEQIQVSGKFNGMSAKALHTKVPMVACWNGSFFTYTPTDGTDAYLSGIRHVEDSNGVLFAGAPAFYPTEII